MCVHFVVCSEILNEDYKRQLTADRKKETFEKVTHKIDWIVHDARARSHRSIVGSERAKSNISKIAVELIGFFCFFNSIGCCLSSPIHWYSHLSESIWTPRADWVLPIRDTQPWWRFRDNGLHGSLKIIFDHFYGSVNEPKIANNHFW